jgi:hypothetical protein
VFEILVKFTETKNWKDSLLSVMPSRKGLQVIAPNDETDNSEMKKTPSNEESSSADINDSHIEIQTETSEKSSAEVEK